MMRLPSDIKNCKAIKMARAVETVNRFDQFTDEASYVELGG